MSSVHTPTWGAPEHVVSLLHEIQARVRYPTVVAGDLNARHRDWCTKTNRSGRKLKAWASQYRFSVTAPRDPVFVSKQGRSTIDVYASRGITLTTPNIVSSRGPGEEQAIIFPLSQLRVQKHAPRNTLDYPRTSQQGSSHQ